MTGNGHSKIGIQKQRLRASGRIWAVKRFGAGLESADHLLRGLGEVAADHLVQKFAFKSEIDKKIDPGTCGLRSEFPMIN